MKITLYILERDRKAWSTFYFAKSW